jgi:hypothetical protein
VVVRDKLGSFIPIYVEFCGLWGGNNDVLSVSLLEARKLSGLAWKKRSRGWMLVLGGFDYGILGGQGNRNQNRVDWKLEVDKQGEFKKIVPPSNIVNKGGRTIPR